MSQRRHCPLTLKVSDVPEMDSLISLFSPAQMSTPKLYHLPTSRVVIAVCVTPEPVTFSTGPPLRMRSVDVSMVAPPIAVKPSVVQGKGWINSLRFASGSTMLQMCFMFRVI